METQALIRDMFQQLVLILYFTVHDNIYEFGKMVFTQTLNLSVLVL